ncbi:Hsp70 family protein [Peptacetobacter sp.]|uniref:Hsp70 family protein n=1 Tax=Peptacetobacter sp. TaxID=2991975 RepID=UPI002610E2BE|nr:Hsp70 family protein [Peptacetobacter sp.]
MGKVIGIDLGTTTSEMAYIKNGRPEIIEDTLGYRIIPSIISYDTIISKKEVIGNEAYNMRKMNPKDTIQEIKRHMGENIKIKFQGDYLYPHEISALILKRMKEYAEDKLGEKIDEAVITVPANFNNQQREATKEAGKLAGLKVERIINEPTAAAMAYGIDNLDKEANILVYDLGGGTFDVTVLELYKGVLDVKASRGNNKLGGKDFDERIEKYVIEEFKKEYGIDIYEIGYLDKAEIEYELKEGVKKAKEMLSFQNVAHISTNFIGLIDGKPIILNMELTREKFYELTKDLIESTRQPIQEALYAVGLNYSDIDEVLTVGGSSRIVAVQNLIEELFPGKIRHDVNPDEAVAMGAAIQAGIKSNQIDSENSLVVTDKCSYNLGTNIVGMLNGKYLNDLFDCIIPVDSSIPCSKTKRYYTCTRNQNAVNIDIYEGYNKLSSQNEKINEFELDGIPNAAAGEEAIDITFAYDLNGTLEVTATIVSTGKQANKTIVDKRLEIKESGNLSKYISAEPIKENIENILNLHNTTNEKLGEKSVYTWEDSPLAEEMGMENTIILFNQGINTLNDEDRKKAEDILEKLKQAIINEDKSLACQLDEKLSEILYY